MGRDEHTPHGFRRRSEGSALDQTQRAGNRGQGRAQLVADGGDELALETLVTLARGHVMQESVPYRSAIGLALGDGLAGEPDEITIVAAHAIFAIPGRQITFRLFDRKNQTLEVVFVNQRKNLGGIRRRFFRRQAVELLDGVTGVGKRGATLGILAILIDQAGGLRGNLGQAMAQFLARLDLLPARERGPYPAGQQPHELLLGFVERTFPYGITAETERAVTLSVHP